MKFFFTILIIFVTAQISFAQNYSYYSIIDTEIEWTTNNYGPGISWSHRLWFDENDTIINSNVYKHLNRNYSSIETSNERDYYLREDNSKKVFLHYNSVDYLLYDFNANEGDTIWRDTTNSSFFNAYYYIMSIDSVEIQGELRKLFNVKSNWISPSGKTEWQWIEGIGNISYGPLNFESPEIGYSLSLHKVKNAQSEIFPLTTTSVFDIYKLKECSIYPNPSKDFITVKGFDFIEFNVYDIKGMLILTKTHKENKIDISALEKGIYFIVLIDVQDLKLRKKFVKH